MEEYQKVLRMVGLALVIVGVIDIGFMIYCISNNIGYSSSFNIFAVVAGVYLIKSSIKTARVVTLFAGFTLVGFVGLVFFMFPFLEPIELVLIEISLDPLTKILSYVFTILAIGFVFWVYRQLSSPSVMLARKNAGLSYGPPTFTFVFGGILVIVLSVAMYFLNHGENAEIAKAKAEEQLGVTFKYHVTSMNYSGSHVYARLKAYKPKEVREVKVDWSE